MKMTLKNLTILLAPLVIGAFLLITIAFVPAKILGIALAVFVLLVCAAILIALGMALVHDYGDRK